MPLGGAVVGGVTSLIGGILGSSAASKAAAAQAAANKAAAAGVSQATSGAINAGYAGITEANSAINSGTAAATGDIANAGTGTQSIYNSETGTVQPYQAAGLQGLNSLQSTAGTFNFDPNSVTSNPAYQFQLKQGEQAINNSAAARGQLQSGGTAKALDQYSQGLASTDEANLYNQALTTYNTNQQGMQTLANLGTTANSQALSAGSTYGSQLTSLAGLGANTNLQSAGLLANTATEGNQYVGTTGLQGATQAGNFTVGAGNAQAAGTIGQANAWSGALSGLASAATNYGTLQGLNSMQMGSSPQVFTPSATNGVGATGPSPWTGSTGFNPDGSITMTGHP